MNKEKHERWAFTSWKRPEINLSLVKYMVWQKELCPKTKLEHYQGYIEMLKPYALFQMKSLFKDKGLKIDKARKCRKANHYYCTKNESFAGERYEYGDLDTGNENPNWDWDDLLE